jgi:Fe-S-cluster containining protein
MRDDHTAQLHVIREEVRLRAEEITSAHGGWPCRKGCDDCCRRLASAPRVTQAEWQAIAAALEALPAGTGGILRRRIRESASMLRPVVCPLLDLDSGTCCVYEARPVACRAYGFYAERQDVLGCDRIESIGRQSPDVVWGNHAALEERLRVLGPAAEIAHWLGED